MISFASEFDQRVVIAAGGYVGNDAMVREFTPQLGSKLFPLASTYDDGLGIRLGLPAIGDDEDERVLLAHGIAPSPLGLLRREGP